MSKDSYFAENDIRPFEFKAHQEECLKDDIEFLLAHKDEWVDINCPACGMDRNKYFNQKKGFIYVCCIKCNTVYTNPRPSLELLEKFYSISKNYQFWNDYIFPSSEKVRKEKIFKPRVEKIIEVCNNIDINNEESVLVEVGAGYGNFCEEMKAKNHFKEIIAIEPSPSLAETCKKRGITVINSTIEKVKKTLNADVVVSFEVIEHLYSPKEFIMQCKRLLKKEGLLVLTCPNIRGFDVSSLGMLSTTFDHEHLNYFNTESLQLLLESCGFIVRNVETPGKLDVDIVRNYVLEGKLDLDAYPFFEEILIKRYEDLGIRFQEFLQQNKLSSHMWIMAQNGI